ncbi:hypothetical protein K7432_010032 [Basidiobolus ranarum]|uniref:Protein kinase domain-containing protein n=1 Tax=Basidiobolus ranarum TaxID=34480 RepID=A0ABR2VW50_9FUNG
MDSEQYNGLGHRKSQSTSERSNISADSKVTRAFSTSSTTSLGQYGDMVYSNNINDYEILSPIGFGSSAVVHMAIYKPLQRKVAMKMIDLDFFERNQIDELRRETQVMSLCKHPNVLRVYGSFVHGSKLYLVTPYLSGGSCLDIMKNAYQDGFDEASIATILKQTLQGLEYLHKNGHIHRDVKAGNLLVDDTGSVLLADFGVSSSLSEGGERKGMRKTFVGTPCWMAPEVMEQAGYDYKADIWSFGITAIELATGHAPLAKFPPIKVLMMTLSNDPPTLDRDSTKHRYSKGFKEMIDLCLQKDPKKRPTAEKLLQHSFFKQAKKKNYLLTAILNNLPPLENRQRKKLSTKQVVPPQVVSWDFSDRDPTTFDENLNNNATERKPRVTIIAPGEEIDETTPPQPNLTPSVTEDDFQMPQSTNQTSSNVPSQPSPLVNSVSSQPGNPPVSAAKKSRFVIDTGSETPIQEALPPPLPVPSSEVVTKPEQTNVKFGLGVITDPSNAVELKKEQKKSRFEVNSSPSTVPQPMIRADSHDSTPSNLSRESSVTRASRFTVDSPLSTIPPSEPFCSTSSRRGRFELSSGSRTASQSGINSELPSPVVPQEGGYPSTNVVNASSNISSPNASLNRDQGLRMDHMLVENLHHQIETMCRQNEAQRIMMGEIWSNISLIGKGNYTPPNLAQRPTTDLVTTLSNLDLHVHSVVRENDILRKENDALRRELEHMRMLLNIPGSLKGGEVSGNEMK